MGIGWHDWIFRIRSGPSKKLTAQHTVNLSSIVTSPVPEPRRRAWSERGGAWTESFLCASSRACFAQNANVFGQMFDIFCQRSVFIKKSFSSKIWLLRLKHQTFSSSSSSQGWRYMPAFAIHSTLFIDRFAQDGPRMAWCFWGVENMLYLLPSRGSRRRMTKEWHKLWNPKEVIWEYWHWTGPNVQEHGWSDVPLG